MPPDPLDLDLIERSVASDIESHKECGDAHKCCANHAATLALIAEVRRLRGLNERLGWFEYGGSGVTELKDLYEAIEQISSMSKEPPE